MRRRGLRPGGRKGERASAFLPALVLLAALVCTFGPPALAQEKKGEPAVAGGVYRRPLGQEPETLDPARISDIYSRSVSQQIFDGLVQFDQTLTIAPALAEFWKASRDGLSWTFSLRRGVRFHNGREVTADDVVFSLTRLLDPRTRSGAADLFINVKGARDFRAGRATGVTGFVAQDRYTIQILLNEAVVPIVAVLAVGHAKIVPKDVVEQEGEAFGHRPVGTGPFKFLRWERGKTIVLEGNADYYDGPPRLRQVVYRIFPGEQRDQMWEEFRRGRLEDAPIPARADRAALTAGGYTYVKRPMISIKFYGINTRLRPFTDRRVRQALLYAVDREAIVRAVYRGQFIFARGILPPGTQGFNPRLAGYPYDPARARALLAEAGYPGGRGLGPIAIWSSVKREDVVREHELIKRALAAVGITPEVHYLTDWPAFARLLDEGKFPVFMYGWYADVPDPDNFLFKLFSSHGPRNFFGYSNPIVDDVLFRARNEQDIQRRVELYRRAEELILGDAPLIPIFHHTYERVFQPYVRAIEVSGLGDPYIPFRKIWLERAR